MGHVNEIIGEVRKACLRSHAGACVVAASLLAATSTLRPKLFALDILDAIDFSSWTIHAVDRRRLRSELERALHSNMGLPADESRFWRDRAIVLLQSIDEEEQPIPESPSSMRLSRSLPSFPAAHDQRSLNPDSPKVLSASCPPGSTALFRTAQRNEPRRLPPLSTTSGSASPSAKLPTVPEAALSPKTSSLGARSRSVTELAQPKARTGNVYHMESIGNINDFAQLWSQEKQPWWRPRDLRVEQAPGSPTDKSRREDLEEAFGLASPKDKPGNSEDKNQTSPRRVLASPSGRLRKVKASPLRGRPANRSISTASLEENAGPGALSDEAVLRTTSLK